MPSSVSLVQKTNWISSNSWRCWPTFDQWRKTRRTSWILGKANCDLPFKCTTQTTTNRFPKKNCWVFFKWWLVTTSGNKTDHILFCFSSNISRENVLLFSSEEQLVSIAERTIVEADKDGDQMISFQEFCTALERTDVEQKMSIRFLNWKQNFKELFVRTFLSRKRQNQITVNILYTRLKRKKKRTYSSLFSFLLGLLPIYLGCPVCTTIYRISF